MQNRSTSDRDGRGGSGWLSKMEQKQEDASNKQQIVCKTVAPAIETVALEAAGNRKWIKQTENAMKKNNKSQPKKSTKHRPKFCQKSPKNRPKICSKWVQNQLWSRRRFGVRFCADFGPIFGPTWGHLGGQVGAMLGKKLIFGSSRRHAKTTMISNTLPDPLGTDFGTILGSKIEPKSVQHRSQERS